MNVTHINNDLLNIFKEVTQISALSQNEKPVADYIKLFFEKLSIPFYEDNSQTDTKSNTGNIIAEINGGGDFILTSHMDTARSTENVKIILNDDRITSDGNTVLGVDNRAGVAILLTLLRKIKTEKLDVIPFSVAFTVCEETTLAGSKKIELKDKIKNAFVFDSYLDPGFIVNNALGAATFKYKVIGKASHSGISPEKGINSIKIVSKILSALEQGEVEENTTLNVGKIEGGTAVNVVPEITTFEGEIRSSDKAKIESKLSQLNSLVKKECKNFAAEYKSNIIWDFEPYFISEDNNAYKAVFDAIVKADLTPIAALSRGGSDANSFNARGITALNLGIGAKNPHSNDEYILSKDFNNAFQIAINLVLK